MLHNTFGIWHLSDRPSGYPVALQTLLCSLRTLRDEYGLPQIKALGTEHHSNILVYADQMNSQAKQVHHTLQYMLDGKQYATAQPVLTVIRNKARKHHLMNEEVILASGLPRGPNTLAYLHGRQPDNPSLYALCILAETLSMDVQFILTRLEAPEATPSDLTNTVN